MQAQSHLTEDIKIAATHAILSAWSLSQRDEHPQAPDFFGEPLSKLARACGRLTQARPHDNETMVMARGMASQDFGQVLANAAQVFAANRYRNSAPHLSFCEPIEVRDYRPVDFADASIAPALDPIGENAEVTRARVSFGGTGHGQLTRYAKILNFSERVVRNDQSDLVKTSLAGLGAAAGRREGAAVYALLEANEALADGSPVFHAGYGNIVGALDATTLAAAMAALRQGMTGYSGDIADLEARFLIVAADLELSAKKLVHDSGIDLVVIASANLVTGRWYLLPDPQIQPVVGVLRLRGSTVPILLEPMPRPIQESGFCIKAGADIGAGILTRHAVRGGA